MNEAIKCAIEGGWNDVVVGDENGQYRAFLDPFFWQALGKMEGWEETSHRADALAYSLSVIHNKKILPRWRREWHHFIDHLAEGATPDDFFNELLKK